MYFMYVNIPIKIENEFKNSWFSYVYVELSETVEIDLNECINVDREKIATSLILSYT